MFTFLNSIHSQLLLLEGVPPAPAPLLAPAAEVVPPPDELELGDGHDDEELSDNGELGEDVWKEILKQIKEVKVQIAEMKENMKVGTVSQASGWGLWLGLRR